MLADSRWREAAAPEALGSLARAGRSRDLSVGDRTSLAVDPLRSSGSAENEEFWSWLVRPERWRCGCVARGLRRIAVADRRAGRDAASLGGNDAGDPVRALNPNENNNMNTEVALGFFDGGIEALLERCPWFVRRCSCLITCLDSGRNTADALACCLPKSDVRSIGQFGLITGETAINMRETIFAGFDEMYVFEGNFDLAIHPTIWKHQYTSDRIFLRDAVPAELLATFQASGAVRYASDGSGLNVLARQGEDLNSIAAVFGRA